MTRSTFPRNLSTWWRGKVEIKKNRLGLITLNPIEDQLIQYDPFDWYFPQGESTREQRSLPYLFLDVDAGDLNAVTAFTERFGVLGLIEPVKIIEEGVKGRLKWLDPVSYTVLDESMLDIPIDKLSTDDLRCSPRPVNKSLCVPMHIEDFKGVQKQLKFIVEAIRLINQSNDREKIAALRQTIGRLITGKLGIVCPSLVWDDFSEQWVTSWEIGSLLGAMYLMLIFDIQGRGHILTCPWCNKTFLGDHPRTLFCSPRCQNSEKVSRHRAKSKLGEKKNKLSTNKPVKKRGKK